MTSLDECPWCEAPLTDVSRASHFANCRAFELAWRDGCSAEDGTVQSTLTDTAKRE